MQIQKQVEEKKLVLFLEGQLDTKAAPDLEKELKSSLDGITELVFDMEKLDYISSAGLRVLLQAQKTMNKQGSMVLCHVCDTVKDVFALTGFDQILTIQ